MIFKVDLDNYQTLEERTRYDFMPGDITIYKTKLFFVSAVLLQKNTNIYILHQLKIQGYQLYINTNPLFVYKKEDSYKSLGASRIDNYKKHVYSGYSNLFHFLFEDFYHFTKKLHHTFIPFLMDILSDRYFKVDLSSYGNLYSFTLQEELLLTARIYSKDGNTIVEDAQMQSTRDRRSLYEFSAKKIEMDLLEIYLEKNIKPLLVNILQAEVNNIQQ